MLRINPKTLILILFHLLFIATPFVFTWINEELFEFNKMLFVYSLTILILGMWSIRMILEKKLIIKKSPLDLPIFLFLLSQLLSTILSIHPRTSVFGYYTRFNGGLLSTFTYISLFYAFISNIDKKQVLPLFISLLLGGLLVSFYAIPEHFGHSPSCLIIMGQFNVDCWVQDVQNRVFASFGQPNWLAAYTITLIPVSLGLFFSQKSKKLRTFLYACFVGLLITTIFTKSRSGQLGLAFGLSSFLLGSFAISKNYVKELLNFKTFFLIIILVTLIFGTTFSPSIKELFSFQNENETIVQSTIPMGLEAGGTDSGEIRKIVWKGAIKVWQRYPFFGSGVETFAYSYYQDRPLEHNMVSEWDFLYNKAHNEFLNILATSGILGLLTYLNLFGTYAYFSVKYLLTKERTHKYLVLGLLSGVIGLTVSNFFGFSTVMVSVLLFLFPAIFIKISEEDDSETIDLKLFKSDIFVYVGIAIVSILVLFGLAGTYRIWKADKTFAQGKSLFKNNDFANGIDKIQNAILLSPQEALYYDELASSYSTLAVHYSQNQEATVGAQLTDASIQTITYALQLNNRHLNFYKTQARIFINLAQIDLSYLENARESLENAIILAPTDPKLVYNLALVLLSQGEIEAGISELQKSIEMKPNYINPRMELAKQYQKQEKNTQALEQYQYLLDNIIPDNQEVIEKINELSQL